MTGEELQQTLFKAIHQADLAHVKRLMKKGADLNGFNDAGQTPLAVACYASEPMHARPIIEYFLKKGADINKYNDGGATPLFNAVRAGRHLLVQRLLEEGANPNINLFPKRTPSIVSSALDLVFNRYIAAIVRSKKCLAGPSRPEYEIAEVEIESCRSLMFLLTEAGARRHEYEPVPEYS
jgi:ankyrin repeat protein